jgi:aspartate oxidase
VDKLIQFGADFTKDEKGELHLAREAGLYTSQIQL